MTQATAEPSTELTTLNALPSTSMESEEYNNLTKGPVFLGRVQLYSKGKAIDKGLMRPGHFGIPESQDEIIDLGNSIDILPLARRPKAMDISDVKDIVSVFDPNDEEFARIREASSKPNSGCMFGVSFLVYERTTGRYLEYFFGTKSTRPEAAKVYPFLPVGANEGEPRGPKPVTLKSKLVENKAGNTWHVPVVTPCSTPVEIDEEKAVQEIKKFLNPPKNEVVEAPENERAR